MYDLSFRAIPNYKEKICGFFSLLPLYQKQWTLDIVRTALVVVSKRLLVALALIVVPSIRETSAGLSCPLFNVHAYT